MILLAAFALVAGAGTALSPCVLPILPAVLSAGVTGGRRRPLGVVVGLALSFTFSAVALVYVIEALGLPNDIARTIAVVVLLVFGLTLLLPPLAARIEGAASRLSPTPPRGRGEGFGSGLLVGAGLGLVYLPCAGPILAGVITVSAAQDFTAGRLAITLSYGIGSAVVLYVLLQGGRRITIRLRPYRERISSAMGVVMIAVAAVMATDLDVRFQSSIASSLPSFLVNPTGELESSALISDRLAEFRGAGHGALSAGVEEAAAGESLPVLAESVPELTGTQRWFNTGGAEPSIRELTAAGEVVLVDFWTYTCINCIRTLPHLTAWEERYGDEGLTIIGVHSPEFAFERDPGNVADAIEQNGIEYPVVQDNELATWSAWSNEFWPAKYLVDSGGRLRLFHFGEGSYEETEAAIRSLLAEAGERGLGAKTKVTGERIAPGLGTPEIYLGARRASTFITGPLPLGRTDFGRIGDRLIDRLPPNATAYQGAWAIDEDGATARSAGARLDLNFKATEVFAVLGSTGARGMVRVRLDGEPLPDRLAGPDVTDGVVSVGEQRLYRLVELDAAERHVLTLEPEAGVAGYAFTFG